MTGKPMGKRQLYSIMCAIVHVLYALLLELRADLFPFRGPWARRHLAALLCVGCSAAVWAVYYRILKKSWAKKVSREDTIVSISDGSTFWIVIGVVLLFALAFLTPIHLYAPKPRGGGQITMHYLAFMIACGPIWILLAWFCTKPAEDSGVSPE